LPEESAELFIKSLIKASDIILFSAAIPFQGGTNHVNEQWPEYWNAIFNQNGYIAIDYLRKKIWSEGKVIWWYSQNIMLYVKEEKVDSVKVSDENRCIKYPPMSLVSPEVYLGRIQSYLRRIQSCDCYGITLFKLYKVMIKRTITKIVGQKFINMIKGIMNNIKIIGV
jgi:hypothetical protein